MVVSIGYFFFFRIHLSLESSFLGPLLSARLNHSSYSYFGHSIFNIRFIFRQKKSRRNNFGYLFEVRERALEPYDHETQAVPDKH